MHYGQNSAKRWCVNRPVLFSVENMSKYSTGSIIAIVSVPAKIATSFSSLNAFSLLLVDS